MTVRTITPATLAALALLPAVAGARPAVPLAVKLDPARAAVERPSNPRDEGSVARARDARTQGRHDQRGHSVAGVAADRRALYVAAVIARQVER